MSATAKPSKLQTLPIGEVLRRCGFPPEIKAQVASAADVPQLIAALTQAELLVEASRALAHALPKREAVWWACMCAGSSTDPNIAEADKIAREQAETWVRDKSDASRRAAMAAAKQAGFQSPEAWAGTAAFWSGDFITAPDAPPVPPPPHLTGVAVAGAVALASVRGKPGKQKQRLARFLQSAHDIAAGGAGRMAPEPE